MGTGEIVMIVGEELKWMRTRTGSISEGVISVFTVPLPGG